MLYFIKPKIVAKINLIDSKGTITNNNKTTKQQKIKSVTNVKKRNLPVRLARC